MLSNENRARCAAALRPANAEMLQRWAEWANVESLLAEHVGSPPSVVETLAGLAALALAVAEMTEGDSRIEQDVLGISFLCLDVRCPQPVEYGGCDLLPALAALVRKEP